MKKFLFVYFVLLPFVAVVAQENNEDELNAAYQNAKKGVYWALSNIPVSKLRLGHELIAEDKLVAEVKLDVEINGIRIVSTGYFNSTEVSIKVYKSVESLQKEGYLKNKKLKTPQDD